VGTQYQGKRRTEDIIEDNKRGGEGKREYSLR